MSSELYQAIRFLHYLRQPKFKFTQRWLGDSSEQIGASLEIICDGPPLERLPMLAPLLGSPVDSIRQSASKKMIAMMAHLQPLQWPSFDENLRDHRIDLPPDGFDLAADPTWIVTAGCHHNGRFRESALDLSGELSPWMAACLLAVRSNDWVMPVRSKARKKLIPALATLDPDEAMAIAPLVNRLRNCGRQSEPEFVEELMTILARRINESSWLAYWKRCSQKDRRVSVELLKLSGLINQPAVRDAILRSNQRAALLWYIRQVLPTLDTADRLGAVERLSNSKLVPVRREWITSLMETDPGEAIGKLKELLCDPSTSLRSFSRFYISRMAPMDFATHYRLLLKDPRQEASALIGLSEVAPEEASAEAVGRLESPVPRVRKAAILVLDAKSTEERITWLLGQASGSMPGVAKAARIRVSEVPGLAQHLMDNWEEFLTFPTSFQVHLVRASKKFGKWVTLEFLLRCSSIPQLDEETALSLKAWHLNTNKSFPTLSLSKKSDLKNLLPVARISPQMLDFLIFTLK